MENYRISYFEAQKWAFSFTKLDEIDRKSIILILCSLNNWNNVDLLIHYNDIIPSYKWIIFQKKIRRYLMGEPVQYILGFTDFYGLKFKVNSNTLIPRIETEELVDWINSDLNNCSNLDVLDLGTGTGAIGLTLKYFHPNWNITLSDISLDALKMARLNMKYLGVKVKIINSNLFDNIKGSYQIIVSNPPYISYDEVEYMDRSVLQYEPHIALFAKNYGLYFYYEIAKKCVNHIKDHGILYLEIGFKQGDRVKQIFRSYFPHSKITLKKDLNGKDRMIKIEF